MFSERKGNTDELKEVTEEEHEAVDNDITLKEKKILTQRSWRWYNSGRSENTLPSDSTLTCEESDGKDTIKNCLDNNEIVNFHSRYVTKYVVSFSLTCWHIMKLSILKAGISPKV